MKMTEENLPAECSRSASATDEIRRQRCSLKSQTPSGSWACWEPGQHHTLGSCFPSFQEQATPYITYRNKSQGNGLFTTRGWNCARGARFLGNKASWAADCPHKCTQPAALYTHICTQSGCSTHQWVTVISQLASVQNEPPLLPAMRRLQSKTNDTHTMHHHTVDLGNIAVWQKNFKA